MLMIISPKLPYADKPYWPGRRLLACVDAVAWPCIAAYAVSQLPADRDLMRTVLLILCALVGVRRFARAAVETHRYRFTTAFIATVAAVMLAYGLVMHLGFGFFV